MTFAIVGRGRVGRGLGRTLRAANQPVKLHSTQAFQKRPRLRKARLLVLAVPDHALPHLAAALAGRLPAKLPVVHCAGAKLPTVLQPLRDAGHPVGVMHPLVSFASTAWSPSVTGTTFTVSGDPPAVTASKALCRALGAIPLKTRPTGPAYHAAAALVANGAAALATVGATILRDLGFDERASARALGSLLRTVGENVETLGVPEALTGPVARGDVDTVRTHRNALRHQTRQAYDRVGPLILAAARIDRSKRRAIANIFRGVAE